MESGLWNSGAINLWFEHDHGALNRFAEITGIVSDQSGAVIPRTRIQLLETAAGKVHSVTTGDDGRFNLAGLSGGRYEIQACAPGFNPASRAFSLRERDRAVFTVILEVGMVTETVQVDGASPLLQAESAQFSTAASLPRAMTKTAPPAPGTHVRSWFPEALYVAPEIITDGQGRASITIPIADSITTWRMAMLASTKRGALGSGTSSLKVFQDFFAELDLPVTITEGDQVSIPVAVYNYSGSRGKARLAAPAGRLVLTGG